MDVAYEIPVKSASVPSIFFFSTWGYSRQNEFVVHAWNKEVLVWFLINAATNQTSRGPKTFKPRFSDWERNWNPLKDCRILLFDLFNKQEVGLGFSLMADFDDKLLFHWILSWIRIPFLLSVLRRFWHTRILGNVMISLAYDFRWFGAEYIVCCQNVNHQNTILRAPSPKVTILHKRTEFCIGSNWYFYPAW